MKNTLLISILLLPFFVSAQDIFTITGHGKLLKNGDRIFLQYNLPDEVVNDSVLVSNQEFYFRGTIGEPVRAKLYRNQNPKYAEEMFDDATVYLEKGNIILHSIDTLLNAVNSGTPLNNDYAELATALRPFEQIGRMLRDPFSLDAQELKDSSFVAKTKMTMVNHRASMVPVKFSFVDQHLSSYVSLVVLTELVKESNYLKQVEQSFAKLSPALKSSVVGEALKSNINLGKKITVGMTAFDFSQPDSNGHPVKLSDYRGKYVLLDFWASWCGPCRAENPNVLAAFKKYKNKGFMVLSVSIDEAKDKSEWLKAIKEDGLMWPQLSDLTGNKNLAYKLYGITTIPANLLISPDGIVIAKDLKREELQLKLAALFK